MNIDSSSHSQFSPIRPETSRTQSARNTPESIAAGESQPPAIADRFQAMVEKLKAMPDVRPDAVEAGRRVRDAQDVNTQGTAERLAPNLTPFEED